MRHALPVLAGAILLASCSQSTVGIEVDDYDTKTVVLTFSPYEVDPMTKADVSIADLSKRLDVFIYEGDEEVTSIHQSKDDMESGFGSVSATLKSNKTYKIYAVAHKGNGPTTLEDGVMTWPDNKITETFYYSTTLSPNYTNQLNCVMHRIVGMFKFVIQDSLPENLASVTFSIAGTNLAYDVESGPVNPGEKVSIINNPTSGNDGTIFKIYCLAEDDLSTIDVTVTAKDSNGEVIETMTFEDVPLQAGYITTFKGKFFVTLEMVMGFKAPSEWSSFDEETF